MAINGMTPPPEDHPFIRKWEPHRPAGDMLLPSIRELLAQPGLLSDPCLNWQPRTPPSALSPTGTSPTGTSPTGVSPTRTQFPGRLTPPEYTISSDLYKRRRVSYEQEQEYNRAHQIPRLYTATYQAASQPQSPSHEARPSCAPLTGSGPPSPYHDDYSTWRTMKSPVISSYARIETRSVIHTLPPPNFEPGAGENIRRQGHIGEQYVVGSPRRSSFATENGYPVETSYLVESGHPGTVRGHAYQQQGYGYGYMPNRTHSVGSGPPGRPPFSSTYEQHHYPNYTGEYSTPNVDNNKRKRRGNLPKEVTEKLRAWFLGHISHPYPTEDEKQRLVRETGLQINQISNWFINARRRQLPHMVKDANVENNVINNLSADGKPKDPQNEDHEKTVYKILENGSKGPRTRGLKRGSI
ncbi:homeobox KN domain-containing protein [Xylaria telfairii]|nr:homeobox KN domain-containing protein [Xylaria telfairii]